MQCKVSDLDICQVGPRLVLRYYATIRVLVQLPRDRGTLPRLGYGRVNSSHSFARRI